MADPREESPLPANRLLEYLQTLVAVKPGLFHRQPVCVCASHTINSTEALLELAASIGPHIAILQVHADIVDDWSEETVHQLLVLAKKHAFLVWEGGQILNATIDVLGQHASDSSFGMKKSIVDLVRKKYTRGVIKPASWAGIATAWASGVGFDNQEGDLLIPTLKAAARESVADSVQTIRTEITAENSPPPPETPRAIFSNGDELQPKPEPEPEPRPQQADGRDPDHLTLDYALETGEPGFPQRKSSTISLTRTITQHTEDSGEHLAISERRESVDNAIFQPLIAPVNDIPPPPLLARGLVLFLPSTGENSFTSEYRLSCIAAARANHDFVIGFLSNEPWDVVSQRSDILDDDILDQYEYLNGANTDLEADAAADRQQLLAIFSLVPHNHYQFLSGSENQNVVDDEDEIEDEDREEDEDEDDTDLVNNANGNNNNNNDDDDDESDDDAIDPITPDASNLTADFLSPQAARLHVILGQALKSREASSLRWEQDRQDSPRSRSSFQLLHVPVVSLP